jgi:FkbM family methyltransferase
MADGTLRPAEARSWAPGELIWSNGAHLRQRQCRHGVMLYNLNDQFQGSMLDKYGEYSEGEVDTFAQLLKPGMTAVEVGANIGSHTVALANLVGREGRVVAFEPQRAIHQILSANLALNGLDQVEAHWAAAGAQPGEVVIDRLDMRSVQNFGGYSIRNATQGDRVRLLTVDSFQLPACHLIKIDVEGMEAAVIRGAAETMQRCGPVVFCENEDSRTSQELIELLWSLDYDCYWHVTSYVRMPNYRGDPEWIHNTMVSTNMVCVPRRANAQISGLHKVWRSDQDRQRLWVDGANNFHSPVPLLITDVALLLDSALKLEGLMFLESARDYCTRILELQPGDAQVTAKREAILARIAAGESA